MTLQKGGLGAKKLVGALLRQGKQSQKNGHCYTGTRGTTFQYIETKWSLKEKVFILMGALLSVPKQWFFKKTSSF